MSNCILCGGCLESIHGPCDFSKASSMTLFKRLLECRNNSDALKLQIALYEENDIPNDIVQKVYKAIESRNIIEKQWSDYATAVEHEYTELRIASGLPEQTRVEIYKQYRSKIN